MRRADLTTGIVFLIFSALYYFYLIPNWIILSYSTKHIKAAARPDLLPRITIVLFAAISAILILGAVRGKYSRVLEKTSRSSFLMVGAIFIGTYAYIWALKLVGFLPASPIYMAALIVLLGMRNWRYVVPLSLLFPIFLHYFFWVGLEVILPEGSLF